MDVVDPKQMVKAPPAPDAGCQIPGQHESVAPVRFIDSCTPQFTSAASLKRDHTIAMLPLLQRR